MPVYAQQTQKIKELIIKILLQKYPKLSAIYLFGSFVNNTSHQKSDIDIAILAEYSLDKYDIWQIAQEIASKVYKDVDLIDLVRASLVMRNQIITKGICIYQADSLVRDIFEDYVYSAYARFNEERKAILNSITQRGTIYG